MDGGFCTLSGSERPTQACVDLPRHTQRRRRETLCKELQHIILEELEEITLNVLFNIDGSEELSPVDQGVPKTIPQIVHKNIPTKTTKAEP